MLASGTHLPPVTENLYFIHYESDTPARSAEPIPPVWAIIVQNYDTHDQATFSTAHIAAAQRSTPAEPISNPLLFEAEMLTGFYQFVRERPGATWVHWNMRKPVFGFDVLSGRARVCGVEAADIPHRFDLLKHLRDRNELFVGHPQFQRAVRCNLGDTIECLREWSVQPAWDARLYGVVVEKLSAKVGAMRVLFDRVRLDTFVCEPPDIAAIAEPRREQPDQATEPPAWVTDRLTRNGAALTRALWGKGSVPISTLWPLVWKGRSEKPPIETIESAVKRANGNFADLPAHITMSCHIAWLGKHALQLHIEDGRVQR